MKDHSSIEALGYVYSLYTEPDRNRLVPNRTGPDRLPFTRDRLEPIQVFYMKLVWYGCKTGLANQQVQCWIRLNPGYGPVPERSRVNRRPILSDFRTGSIWIRLGRFTRYDFCLRLSQCKHSLDLLYSFIFQAFADPRHHQEFTR